MVRSIILLIIVVVIGVFTWLVVSHRNEQAATTDTTADHIDTTNVDSLVVDGKDAMSGLIAKGDYIMVRNTCTACHSSTLILQAHFSRDTWIEKIRWMQANQKLWDLGSSEKPILDYLEKFYGPDSVSSALRRPPLKDIEWYTLE